MRLFLSSQDFGKYPDVALRLSGNNQKAAFIKNAQDDQPINVRNFSTPEKKVMFENAGFEFEEIDLRDYFGKASGLKAKLNVFGSIWCAGGNTFILRRAMKASGLDNILVDWLKKDKIMYGGWSAGACVTAVDLHGIEYGDRPQPGVVPSNYPLKETVWEGLGLVSFMIVPHYKSDRFGKEAEKSVNYLKDHGVLCKPLRDGQAIIIDNDREEFLE